MPKNDKGQEVNDCKINTFQRRRLLSVGKFLPREWNYVRVIRTRYDEDTVWLQVKRLTVVEGE